MATPAAVIAPEKRPRGRPPRPADQQTRLVAVRLTAAQIERAVALGSGDISAGIRRALHDADTASPAHADGRTP